MKNVVNYVKFEFPSCSSNESFSRTAVACFAAQLDPTLEEINDIKTAVSEAVTNCIVHAYPDRIGRISIRARLLSGGNLEVVIRDWGVGIEDIEKARTPLFSTGNEERSGMGFTIMESFMDSLRIRSVPGRGTTVTLKKKISRRSGGRS
jgi:stage II sporulation protein AB (anti-sigma F factor)